MDASNRSREELLSDVDRLVDLLVTAGSIQNLVSANPVDGPKMHALSREALNAAVTAVTSFGDEKVMSDAIGTMAANVLEINVLVKKHFDTVLSKLGGCLIQLPVEDYVDIESRNTDIDIVKKAAEIAEKGNLHLPEGAEIAGVKAVGSLNKLLGHFVEMAGGPEKFADFQIKSAQSIPKEMVGTPTAIVMTLIGAISGAVHARIRSNETAEATLSCLLSVAHTTRDILTMPTLSAAVSMPHLVEFVSGSIKDRVMEDLKQIGIEAKKDPAKGPVVTEPARRGSNVIDFPQSRTVH